MSPWKRVALAALAGGAIAAQVTPAATSRSWTVSTAGEFAAGTLEGTALDAEGRLVLGPQVHTLWGPDPGIVWAVAAADNDTFVGLSGPGRVLRVTRDARVESWVDLGEDSLFTALALAPRRGVFAGRSPEGEVLHITSPGEFKSRGTTDARFVWALAVAADGALWVGTGSPGRLLKSPDSGVMVEVLVTGDDPVRCLAALPDGGVVAGTGGRGRVIRVDRSGRPFVLFDADEKEIVAVAAAAGGTVYALAAGGPKSLRNREAAAAAQRTADNTVTVTAQAPPGDAPVPEDEPEGAKEPPRPVVTGTAGGALYRIEPDGSVRKIWETSTELPFDMILAGPDRLVVATGDQGRVHAIDGQGRAAQLLRISSNQASALALAPDGSVVVGGSTDARLEAIDPQTRAEGMWLGPAVDAGAVADWGRLTWDAELPSGSALALEIRAGNTDEPDETWSAWAALVAEAGSGAASVPATRWSQVRATLRGAAGAAPVVRSMTLHYLPRNRAPEVTALQVEPPGVVWAVMPAQTTGRSGPVAADDPVARQAGDALQNSRRVPAAIRKAWEHGARTFTWDAADPDDDRLRFNVELRREGTERWYPLALDIEDRFYSWDARWLPDGAYRARLVASDLRDNPEGGGLEHHAVSEVFHLDNTRPEAQGFAVQRAAGGVMIGFEAIDTAGRVAAVEVSFDGEPWRILAPDDGVADSARERYHVPAEGGPATLRVRVTDASGNLGGTLWPLD